MTDFQQIADRHATHAREHYSKWAAECVRLEGLGFAPRPFAPAYNTVRTVYVAIILAAPEWFGLIKMTGQQPHTVKLDIAGLWSASWSHRGYCYSLSGRVGDLAEMDAWLRTFLRPDERRLLSSIQSTLQMRGVR